MVPPPPLPPPFPQSLLQDPLQERRKALRNTFKEVDGRFRFATFMDHKVGQKLLQQLGGKKRLRPSFFKTYFPSFSTWGKMSGKHRPADFVLVPVWGSSVSSAGIQVW